MSTIAEKLQKLKNIKAAIKAAIQGKGQTVGDKFEDYSTAINNIQLSGMYVEKDDWKVVFVDIDGTVLREYDLPINGTITFPTPPTHEGLEFIQWNQTDTIANHENYYDDEYFRTIVIGPEYDLARDGDGNLPPTTIKLQVNHALAISYKIQIKPTVATGVTIDWGDGSTTTTTTTATTQYSHTYSASGMYSVKIIATSGTYQLIGTSSTYAFTNFQKGIKEAIIGKGCTQVGAYCFYNCYSLRKLWMSSDVTSVGAAAIYQCYALKELNISYNITSLAVSSFCTNCYALKAIIIPHRVTSVANSYVFASCYAANYISIPKSVTTFSGYSCFTGLRPIFVSSNINRFKDNNYVYSFSSSPHNCYIKNQSVIETKNARSNPYIIKAKIPEGTTSTLNYGFAYNSVIKEITLPTTLKTINSGSFAHCINLEKINIPNTVTVLGDNAFLNCYQIRELNLPPSTTGTTTSTFQGMRGLESLTIPQNWKTIYGSEFKELYNVDTIDLSNITTFSSTYIFHQSYGLTEMIEPVGLTAATGTYRYYQCYGLRYVRMAPKINYIPIYTLCACSSLHVVDFSMGSDLTIADTRTQVPEFGTSGSPAADKRLEGTTNYISTAGLCFIIVPDNLYDDWYASTYWKVFKNHLIKRTDYYTIFTDNDR